HPVAAIAGYDSYYLNVMAGPDRKWLFTWEDDHAWINTPEYPRHDWRAVQKRIKKAG
ncbi:5-deoxy-glucuronate isomerase, partial [Mycobacterium tuberculosis]|nr:5-deoxy-glucuronate isomerase [Mycobacterium tuberculosis]